MKTTTRNIIDDLIIRYPALAECKEDMLTAVKLLIDCYQKRGKLLVCGNGGSAADAQHIVGELMKGFILPRKLSKTLQENIQKTFPESSSYFMDNLQCALPAISLLGENALISAYSNDKAPDLLFAQQVLGLGDKGDVLLAISTSGNSKNVLYACQVAKIKEMKVIGLAGGNGGKMKELCDTTICAPSKETYLVQEYHLPIYHTVCLALENEFFREEE